MTVRIHLVSHYYLVFISLLAVSAATAAAGALLSSSSSSSRQQRQQRQLPYLKEILLGRCYEYSVSYSSSSASPNDGIDDDTSSSQQQCPSLIDRFLNVLESRLDWQISVEDFAPVIEQLNDLSSPPPPPMNSTSDDNKAAATFWLRTTSYGDFGDESVPSSWALGENRNAGRHAAAASSSPETTLAGRVFAEHFVFCGNGRREDCTAETSNAYWKFRQALYGAYASGIAAAGGQREIRIVVETEEGAGDSTKADQTPDVQFFVRSAAAQLRQNKDDISGISIIVLAGGGGKASSAEEETETATETDVSASPGCKSPTIQTLVTSLTADEGGIAQEKITCRVQHEEEEVAGVVVVGCNTKQNATATHSSLATTGDDDDEDDEEEKDDDDDDDEEDVTDDDSESATQDLPDDSESQRSGRRRRHPILCDLFKLIFFMAFLAIATMYVLHRYYEYDLPPDHYFCGVPRSLQRFFFGSDSSRYGYEPVGDNKGGNALPTHILVDHSYSYGKKNRDSDDDGDYDGDTSTVDVVIE